MISITPLLSNINSTQQEYNSSQEILIPVVDSNSELNPVTDKVIFSIQSPTSEVLYAEQIFKYTIRDYENTTNENEISSVVVFPENDLKEAGYTEGNFNVYYNFYRPALKSDQYSYFLKTISPSRAEVRLSVNNISNEEVEHLVQEFQSLLQKEDLFTDFYIEIDGNYYIANNILLDTSGEIYTILLKLYQPLPPSIVIDTQLQVVFEVAETVGFNINFPPQPVEIQENIEYIKGPNFSYQLSDQVNNSTIEQDYNSLIGVNQLTSSYNELENILSQKGISINIDYEDFNNFIQFSSAKQRLLNFYYKVGQIESFNNDINNLNTITGPSTTSISSSKSSLEAQITDIIKNFDGYENYLYYTSGALAYPKSNSSQPYTLYSTGSVEVLTWLGSDIETSSNYGGRLLTASLFDNENQENLFNLVPTYLSEDPANAGYELFLNMIGQHFDILYSYINVITEKNNADNRLDYGISKDLVADALRNAGLKLYQNNFSSDELYSAIIGYNPDGTTLPPTGSEVIDTYVAVENSAIPLNDLNKETYKRLYHNLPYLLKKKGTVEGLRALINCFGIPDTILRISEFGGKDKNNTNDYDYTHDRFSYSLYANAVDQVVVPWTSSLFRDPVPQSIFFRFKTDGYRDSQTQALLVKDSADPAFPNFWVKLEHTGSGALTSGSYSGSIQSQSAEYGNLIFGIGNPGNSLTASVNLPFYNNDWWGVSIVKERYNYRLRVGQKIYNGQDGWKLGYYGSDETGNLGVLVTNNYWNPTGSVKFSNSVKVDSAYNIDTTLFKGYYQEIRFYNGNFDGTEGAFDTITKDYIMNPTSLESLALTGSNSTFNTLSFRAALGNELIGATNSLFIPPLIFITEEGLPTSLPFNLPLLNNVINPSSGLPVSLPFTLPLYATSTYNLTSIHPAITASADLLISQSFGNNSTYQIINYDDGQPFGSHLVGNTEFYYFDQPAVGIRNRVSEKIKNFDLSLPSGDTLSPYRSIQQNYPSNRNYTKDVNYVEVALSPQNEINDDINSTFGYFNIGEYIGDPRQVSESHYSYPELDKIRDSYFEKYYKSYNWKDYIRLIKYFDNSLFKMVQDFVPASSELASGVVIKQHLLERNRQRPAQVEYSQHDYTGSIESGFISGGAGGGFNSLNVLGNSTEGQSEGFTNPLAPFVTQSWVYRTEGISGSIFVTQSTQDEFYNGEFSGSVYTVTKGNLNTIIINEELNVDDAFVSNYTPVIADPNGPASTDGGFQYNGFNTGFSIQIYQLEFNFDDTDGNDRSSYFESLQYGDIVQVKQSGGNVSNGEVYLFTVQNEATLISGTTYRIPVVPLAIFSSDWFYSSGPDTKPWRVILIKDLEINTSTEIEADNPTLNNVLDANPSSIYEDVDYSDNYITPVNFNLLISGSGQKFPIPDSNYTQAGWSNSRYNGSRNSSIDFNQ